MDVKNENHQNDQRKKEFAAGFFAGTAVIGVLALILLAFFWF